jgi:organic hydroperoxide reductase OsmC/OhrA
LSLKKKLKVAKDGKNNDKDKQSKHIELTVGVKCHEQSQHIANELTLLASSVCLIGRIGRYVWF